MTEEIIKGLGYRRDLPDFRDLPFTTRGVIKKRRDLPPHFDLLDHNPPVYDQGQLGSCVGQSIAGCYAICRSVQAQEVIKPSPLFVYYFTRQMEGTVEVDAGCTLRNGMKVVNNMGACLEELWPYKVTKFREHPVQDAVTDALLYQVIQYERLPQDLTTMKQCLFDRHPFVFGFAVYDSFYQVDSNGQMSLPSQSENMLGGHAVCAVGYDDEKQIIMVRNSWGKKWGAEGYFAMPYSYITDRNLAADFWTMKLVE